MIKSANILATYKNKVLVQKRDFSKNIKYKGYYCLFGGHLHKNESFIKAAKREFFEETNLKINSCKFFLELKFSFKRVSYMKKFYHYKLDKAWKKYFIFREGESFELISKKQLMRKKFVPFDLCAILYYYSHKDY
tara:strand:+ start:60 stop:464 length:405 start_codon:yes stop_codon:yes gene_type:complete